MSTCAGAVPFHPVPCDPSCRGRPFHSICPCLQLQDASNCCCLQRQQCYRCRPLPPRSYYYRYPFRKKLKPPLRALCPQADSRFAPAAPTAALSRCCTPLLVLPCALRALLHRSLPSTHAVNAYAGAVPFHPVPCDSSRRRRPFRLIRPCLRLQDACNRCRLWRQQCYRCRPLPPPSCRRHSPLRKN